MSDLISRQVENVANIISLLSDIRSQYNCFDPDEEKYYHALSEAIKALLTSQPDTCAYWDRESNICALHRPSAQPEIIRCKDCEYWREDHTCREHSLVSPMAANEFCSRAERREG